MKAIFISDVHLQDAQSKKTLEVLEFLRTKGPQFEHVYILGDLFDVWPGTSDRVANYIILRAITISDWVNISQKKLALRFIPILLNKPGIINEFSWLMETWGIQKKKVIAF